MPHTHARPCIQITHDLSGIHIPTLKLVQMRRLQQLLSTNWMRSTPWTMSACLQALA